MLPTALLGLLMSPAGPLQAAEHCANGDFETLTPDGKTPAQWAYIAADNGDGTLEVGEGVEGGRCAKVTCTRAEGIWGPGIGQTGVVETKGGQWYDLAFWARQEGITSGVIAALRNVSDWNANHLWQQFHPTSSWREYHAVFKAPYDLAKDVSRLQFSFDSTGTLWLDRVSLTETTAPKSPNVVDVGTAKNCVPNSSFEVGTFGWGTYGSTFLVGGIDETTAWHGHCSFKLDLSPDKLPIHWNDFTYVQRGKPTHAPVAVSLVTAGYLPVTPGKPMVLSAYVKADRPGGKVRLGIIEDSAADRSNAVEVGTDWRRVVVPIQPQAETAFVRVALEPGEGPQPPTTLWVDAVQLEAGEQATAYEPALPVEVGFDTGRVGNLYHVGEPAPLRVSVFNNGPSQKLLDLKLSVEGFFREAVADATRTTKAGPGLTVVSVGLPDLGDSGKVSRDPGFYRLHARWDSPAGPQERHLRFGVIHPLREMYRGKDTFLGQNHSFVTDQLMMLTQDAGSSWVRSWFVRWDDIEPEQGRFDFAEADAQLQRLERLGFNVEFCLGDPTSEWASTAPADMKESTGAEAESRRVWWMPKDMHLYEDYVAALMERYGKRVRYWEVFNEPVDRKGGENGNLDMAHNYLGFVQAVWRAAARTGTKAEIMGAGLGYLKGMDNTAPVLRAIDILSEHRYPGLQPPEAFQAGIRSAVEAMREKGAVHPIWMTEYGIYADDDPDPTTLSSQFLIHAGQDSEMLAATATVKQEVVALANGVDKVFFHIGNWPIILNREHGCGFHPFFEWGGIPRKMMVTQNVLSWALPPGTRFVRAISDTPPVMIYEFANEQGSVFIAWAASATPVDAKTQDALNAAGAKVYNIVGQRQERLTELSEYPMYVLAQAGAAEAVGKALQELVR
jgi:hypothetical protein